MGENICVALGAGKDGLSEGLLDFFAVHLVENDRMQRLRR